MGEWQVDAIQQQLDLGHVVLLSHLAYSVAGEVLNCNAYDVGTRAAIELQADKLLCLTLDEVRLLSHGHPGASWNFEVLQMC